MFLSTSCPSELDPDLGAKQNSTFCYDCHVVTSTPPDSEIADIFADVDTPPPQTSKENSVGLLQFFNKEELARAIDTYLMNWTIRKNESEIYGYPIGSWDVSLVTDFSNIFDSLRNSAVSTFDADLSDWNTSSAEFMVSTFAGASSFTGDVSNWSTNKVTSMQGMCK